MVCVDGGPPIDGHASSRQTPAGYVLPRYTCQTTSTLETRADLRTRASGGAWIDSSLCGLAAGVRGRRPRVLGLTFSRILFPDLTTDEKRSGGGI